MDMSGNWDKLQDIVTSAIYRAMSHNEDIQVIPNQTDRG